MRYVLAMGRLYEATWSRARSAHYDRGMRSAEAKGLRSMRKSLLSQARGLVVEFGAGTGLNIPWYPQDVTELVLVEPNPHMAHRLDARLAESGCTARIERCRAETTSLEDNSVDTIVSTLFFCSTRQPEAVLSEATRILKPGGQLLFLEHVRSEEPRLARWQDRLEKPRRWISDGCHCNRDTLAVLRGSEFLLSGVAFDEMPRSLPITRPLVSGRAQLTRFA